MPCLPQQKDSATCPLNDRTRSGRRPDDIASAGVMSAHNHVISAGALAACRRGVAWSRRCRAYVSVGGVLETHGRAHAWFDGACSCRSRVETVSQVPAGEVVL